MVYEARRLAIGVAAQHILAFNIRRVYGGMPGLRDTLAPGLQRCLLAIRAFFFWLAQTLFGPGTIDSQRSKATAPEELPLSGADVLAKNVSSAELTHSSPPSPDPSVLVVDLEQGLSAPSTPTLLATPKSASRRLHSHEVASSPAPKRPGAYSTRRAQADASHLTITSAVLSAYIRDGVGISLSESAQDMLGLNCHSSIAQQEEHRKSEWWDGSDPLVPLRSQDSGDTPSTHATLDQESNSRSTPWTSPDLEQHNTLSPLAPLGPNSARASTWAVKSLVVENDEVVPTPEPPSFFFHAYPLPSSAEVQTLRSPSSTTSGHSRAVTAADSPTLNHNDVTVSSIKDDKIGDMKVDPHPDPVEPWQSLLLPAHFVNDLHETFASDFDGMSLSLSTPSILRRRRPSVGSGESSCHESLEQGNGPASGPDSERGLSPSLSAPEPRYYAFYHEFYSSDLGAPVTPAGEVDGFNLGEVKRRTRTAEDLLPICRLSFVHSTITDRPNIGRRSTTLKRLPINSKPLVNSPSSHSAYSNYSCSSLALSSPYETESAESDMFPSTWCVQPMTRSALRRSFLGTVASTASEESICAFLKDEEGDREDEMEAQNSECLLGASDGKRAVKLEGPARLSRMPTFIVPSSIAEDAATEADEQREVPPYEGPIGQPEQVESKEKAVEDVDVEGSVATFVSCQSFDSRASFAPRI
ncbi:hypothetical protein BKA70DRAFT_1569395 [Coprinopsis sp. MPI-PUGE-AT-0042]|nr:hypothetical protein BKA70DRAFT_1569395 [Coprinopsis sp. MPI-PUGE-AT-0042]